MNQVKDGELYKRIELHGKVFDIYYGYYEEFERESQFAEPIPIYPDFECNPEYTDDGYPFVTHMQALCEYGDSRFVEGCCFDCRHFSNESDLIGVCRCAQRRIDIEKK
jgi:hypothetical protein